MNEKIQSNTMMTNILATAVSLLWVLFGALQIGIIWAVMGIGVYITFRILDFADMTTDGSLTLGAAISATCITLGINPWVSLIVAMIGGALAGAITAALHTKLGIPGLISGIITQIGLYSINLHIMGMVSSKDSIWTGVSQGLANIGLRNQPTIYNTFSTAFNIDTSDPHLNTLVGIIVGALVLVAIIILLTLFLKTEKGMALRATGMNQKMIAAQGVNTDNMMFLGLMLGNALIALGGGMVAQMQGFADINTGTGTIAFGLASVIIGELLFSKRKGITWQLIAVVIGSIIYRSIISFVMFLGWPPIDLKLVTAVLMVIFLALPRLQKNMKRKAIADNNDENKGGI